MPSARAQPVRVGSDSVVVVWDANTEPDLSHYVVHLGDSAVFDLYRYGVISPRWVHYRPLEGWTFSVTVTAVDYSGNESAHSNRVFYFRSSASPAACDTCDLNDDGRVSMMDWIMLRWWVGRAGGDSTCYDVTGDGRVDGADKALFARKCGGMIR